MIIVINQADNFIRILATLATIFTNLHSDMRTAISLQKLRMEEHGGEWRFSDFVGALGLSQVDVLGFSIGGYVAQVFTLLHPKLVRRLMLVCTGPRAGEPTQDSQVMQHATTPESSLEDFLYRFFAPSASSQAAGRAFWERRHIRKNNVDPPTSKQTMTAQIAAATEWGQVQGERFAELKSITQPTLVVNGSNDVMIPTINSFILSQHIPNAQLIIYPDSGHASQFQFPDLFLSHTHMFLDG